MLWIVSTLTDPRHKSPVRLDMANNVRPVDCCRGRVCNTEREGTQAQSKHKRRARSTRTEGAASFKAFFPFLFSAHLAPSGCVTLPHISFLLSLAASYLSHLLEFLEFSQWGGCCQTLPPASSRTEYFVVATQCFFSFFSIGLILNCQCCACDPVVLVICDCDRRVTITLLED